MFIQYLSLEILCVNLVKRNIHYLTQQEERVVTVADSPKDPKSTCLERKIFKGIIVHCVYTIVLYLYLPTY